MKKLKTFGILATIALMVGCSSKFLDVSPLGGSIDQKQFDENPQSAEALVRGLYSLMIQGGGSGNHDYFGQKSIDIKTDMISGDIALVAYGYGWFAAVERLQDSGGGNLSSYIWSYLYAMIKNANIIINANKAGLDNPQTYQDTIKSYYVGQAYAMRGYAYHCLSYYYSSFSKVSDNLKESTVPYYSEENQDVPTKPIALEDLLASAENDFITAKNYIARYEASEDYSRISKVSVDTDVVKLLLAYLYIHRAQNLSPNDNRLNDCQNAMGLCDEVISSGKYPILDYDKVLTNGFNSIESNNWMWAVDIDAETTGGLASFWGAMDIFTYSYAYAGDIKAIDQNLYNSMPDSDRRKGWFLPAERLAPAYKFFDRARRLGGDRNWLNDLVFMRSEEAYLIGAEAAYIANDYPKATQYLKPLLDQRDPTVAATITSVADDNTLKSQIIYNWRVEMWGEGKTYFTMRRFSDAYFTNIWCSANDNSNFQRGANHPFVKTLPIAETYKLLFLIPYSEQRYNPWISGQSEFQHQ